MTRLAVIGDTHIPRRAHDLPFAAWREIERSDAVIHTGDIMEDRFLERLAAIRPVHAVRGNNDGLMTSPLPDQLSLDAEGIAIAVIHDSGSAAGRRARMRRAFPTARVVVFGHSHIPVVDDDGDLLLLNPGSPTDRRAQPRFTMAELVAERGRAPRARIIDLGLERAAPLAER
jgi:putative phosphoesterase